MAFRKAKSIELHDAHTIITLSQEVYMLTSPVARGSQANRPAYQVGSADIHLLADLFNGHPQGQVRALFGQRGEEKDPGLLVNRTYVEIPAETPGITISNLECDVIEANLVEIRVEYRRAETPPERDNEVEAITHSGSFTIWWASERPAGAEEIIAQAEAHPVLPVAAEPDGEERIEVILPNIPVSPDIDETGV